MGQKVNPFGLRLGNLYDWNSRWFANDKDYKEILREDILLRKSLMVKLKPAGVNRIEIERSINRVDVIVWVARAGLVIGRGGTGLEELKKFVVGKLTVHDPKMINLRVQSVERPDLSAYLLAVFASDQLMKRMPSRRVMNQVIDRAMRSGAKGARIIIAGRIGGAEIARIDKRQEGTIPLHTLRSDIDFAKVDVLTKSGVIGVKVWVCRSVD